ncbi:serpin family protein [Yinghuangia sp. YIM S10712]|uniref:serpin family protein n=1 Tax=Yinghuangia sp. YIM S10712 TaxID=3436930 RepID=UPI003F5337D9
MRDFMAFGEYDLGIREYAGEIRELGSRWLDRLLSDSAVDQSGGNVVCSPTGLWLALAAISCGALGDTAEELADLLGVAGPEAEPLVTAVARDLAATEALAVATGVWSASPVRDEFRGGLPDITFGELGDPAAIDAWIARATGGMIDRAPGVPSDDALLVLVNALALKARWAEPFDRDLTMDAPFRPRDGDSASVPMMFREVPAADVWTVGAHGGPVHIVELPCAGDHPALIRFALGPRGMAPAPVMSAAWAPRSIGNPITEEEVVLRLPRFGLRTSLPVHDHLPALGVTLALARHAAEFGALSPDPLYIDRVDQESLLRVDEEGVEATAVTEVRMELMGFTHHPSTLRLTFDRPFGCAVMDASGTVPLFAAYQATVPRLI